jgi:tetratricopeptide (TPR) repeat protein
VRAEASRAEGLLGQAAAREHHRLNELLADLALVKRLEEVRIPRAQGRDAFNAQETVVEYGKVFQESGLDVDKQTGAEAVARLRGRRIQKQLVLALDSWAVACRTQGKEEEKLRKVIAIARGLDSDPLRNSLRDVLQRGTLAALKKRIAKLDLTSLPVSTLVHVGGVLATFDVSEGIKLLRQVQDLHPNDFWANYQLAFFLAQKTPPETEDAVRYFSVALALRSQSARVHDSLGVALRKKGDLAGAIAAYQKAKARDPGYAPAHYNLGIALQARGNLAGAIAAFRQAANLNPTWPEAYNNLGGALHAQGDLKGAIAAFKKAVALDPGFARAHYNLGRTLNDRGDLKGAIAAYRKAVAHDPKLAQAHSNLGSALKDTGDLPGAIAAYQKAITQDPEHAAYPYNLGIALQASGDLPGAIAAYQQAIKRNPKWPEAHTNLGVALHARKDLKGASAALQKAIALAPRLAVAHHHLGLVLMDRRDLPGATAAFRKAIAFDPNNARAYNSLGFALVAQKDLPGAIAAFRQAVAHDARDVQAHTSLGLALRDKGDLPGAIAALQRATQVDPKYAQAHGALGDALRRQGRFAEARTATRRALDLLRPSDPLRKYVEYQLGLCEWTLQLEAKLPAILKGKARPANIAEQIGVAVLCHQYKKRYAAAARFFSDAFAAAPALAGDLQSGHRYNAACAAALAAAGKGEDAAQLKDSERSQLRRQALKWLQADLAAWTGVLEKGSAQARTTVRETLAHWHKDADLATLRDKASLTKLAKAEQEGWQKLWADVAALLKKAGEGKKAQDQRQK